jgi:hypothetical protein
MTMAVSKLTVSGTSGGYFASRSEKRSRPCLRRPWCDYAVFTGSRGFLPISKSVTVFKTKHLRS